MTKCAKTEDVKFRSKRALPVVIAGVAVVAAASAIIVYTAMVTKFEINIQDINHQLKYLKSEITTSIDGISLIKNITKDQTVIVNSLINKTQINRQAILQLAQVIPEVSGLISRIQSRLQVVQPMLGVILSECRQGRVATVQLADVVGANILKNIDIQDTKMISTETLSDSMLEK